METYFNRLLTTDTKERIKYHIREGVRSREYRWCDIYADCTRCNESIGIDLQIQPFEKLITNEMAAGIFRGQGWYINLAAKEILCPICKRKGVYVHDGTGCK